MFLILVAHQLRKLFSRRGQRGRSSAKPSRLVSLRLEGLEERVTPSTTTTFVDDNWANISSPGAALAVGDVVQNTNDTINPGGITAVYGVTGFGTVTSGVHTGTVAGAAKIGDAIANTTVGGTVNVLEGTYSELVTINKSLTLDGAQHGVNAQNGRPGAAESILDTTTSSGVTPFNVTASDVTIDGFTIQNQTNVNQFGAAIYLAPGDSGTHVVNNIIQNNVTGLFFVNSSAADQAVIQHNLFQNNNQPGAGTGNAIYADDSTAGGSVANVLIDSNTFINNQSGGVSFDSLDPTKGLTDAAISNNTFTTEGNAILLYNTTSSAITGNTITDSLASQIALAGGVSGLQISQNFIQNGATNGIRIIQDTGSEPNIAPNMNVTVFDNDITGNPTSGIKTDAGSYTGTLDAHDNYWGSASGPMSPNNPSGQGEPIIDPNNQTTVAPYLTSGADSAPNSPGFQGNVAQTASSVAQFVVSSQTVNQSAGTFSITVTLSAMSNTDTTIPFTLSGTAAAGKDYSGVTVSPLVIPAGQTSGTITGTLLPDPGPSQTLVFTLGAPTNATLGATTTDTLTIIEPSLPPPPPPPAPTPPPPSVSVAFGPAGEVVELVSSTGVLTQFDAAGAHLLGGGVRYASVAFGPAGEVVEIVSLNGALTQFDAAGVHTLGGSGVQSASVAFGPGGEVLEVVNTAGILTQFDVSGAHQLGTGGVQSASVAIGSGGEVLDIIGANGALTQYNSAGAQQLTGAGVQSVGVTFAGNSLALDIIFSDGSLYQFDALGQHYLGKVL